MIEAAIVVARLLQYGGAAILFGSPLFFVYAAPQAGAQRWARGLVAGGALLLALGALGGVAAQASLFAGSWGDGLTYEAMAGIVSGMDLGKAAVARLVVAVVAVVLLIVLSPGRGRWLAIAGLGALAAASLAWMGHAAATEGSLGAWHRAADALHALAASAWLGALAVLVPMALGRQGGSAHRAGLHRALLRFSAVGPGLVAALVLTGLVNTWILVGPDRLGALASSAYGQVLLAKLALFAAMLALAAANRWRFTGLAGDASASLRPLRRSLVLEAGAGFGVLAAVGWLGTLVPPAAA